MIGVNEVELVEGDMGKNYPKILTASHLLAEDDMIWELDLPDTEEEIRKRVVSFTVETSEHKICCNIADEQGAVYEIVPEGSSVKVALREPYVIASILYYLAERHNKDQFDICTLDQELIREYFSKDIILDAMENSDTVHKILHALLSEGHPRVTIHRPRHFG